MYMDSVLFNDGSPQLTLPDFEAGGWWVAHSDGLPAAFAGARKCYDEAKPYVYHNKSGVMPYFRGNGLQHALLLKRLNHFKSIPRHVTYTYAYNIHSMNNLMRAGFRMYVPDVHWAGKEMLYWEKIL